MNLLECSTRNLKKLRKGGDTRDARSAYLLAEKPKVDEREEFVRDDEADEGVGARALFDNVRQKSSHTRNSRRCPEEEEDKRTKV